MLDIKHAYYVTKNVKIQCGYINSCIYDFNQRITYVVNKNVGKHLINQDFKSIDLNLLDKLLKFNLLTTDCALSDSNPTIFNYELFDDCNSYSKCRLIYLELTDTCNYNCMHCYAKLSKNNNTFLSFDNFCNILENIKTLGDVDIRLTGGEPFLHPEIRSILEYTAKNLSPLTKHSIVTNGSHKIEDMLLAINLGFELQFSFYGVNATDYAHFTNSSETQFATALKNLKTLSTSKNKANILVQLFVNALTYNKLSALIDELNSLGLRYRLNRPASVGRASDNWKDLELSDTEYLSFAKEQKPLIQNYCYHLCQLHWIAIDCLGYITPCTFIRRDHKEYVLGNALSESLQNIWNNSTILHNFRKLNPNNVKKCNDCEFKYACTAGCCGETLDYTGNILNPYVWCKVKPYENNEYLFVDESSLYIAEKLAAGAFEFRNTIIL